MNDKKYRYWIFYINPDLIDDLSCMINEPNCIYAYTDNKELADLFTQFHDMNKFIKKKLDLSKLELNELARNEQTQYLKRRDLNSHDDNGNLITIKCALTMQEEKHLDLQVMTSLHNLIYKVGISGEGFPARILRSELEKDLEKMRFFSIVNYQITTKKNIGICNNFIDFRSDDIFNKSEGPKIYADELSIYIHLFHNILSEKT